MSQLLGQGLAPDKEVDSTGKQARKEVKDLVNKSGKKEANKQVSANFVQWCNYLG